MHDTLATIMTSSRLTRALANPHRLEIIELLAQGDYPVEQISAQTSLSVANTSQHLQVLKAARLVDVTRNGKFIHYRLANANVFKAWRALRELGVEQIASIDKLVKDFRQSKVKSEPVTIDELAKRIKSDKVTILDVRPGAIVMAKVDSVDERTGLVVLDIGGKAEGSIPLAEFN